MKKFKKIYLKVILKSIKNIKRQIQIKMSNGSCRPPYTSTGKNVCQL